MSAPTPEQLQLIRDLSDKLQYDIRSAVDRNLALATLVLPGHAVFAVLTHALAAFTVSNLIATDPSGARLESHISHMRDFAVKHRDAILEAVARS